MQPLTSRERLLKALRLEQPDRVPVSLYLLDPEAFGWYLSDPTYTELLELAERYTDKFGRADVGNIGPFLSAEGSIPQEIREERRGNSLFITTIIHTPKGDLRSVVRRDDGVYTTWKIEPFLKDMEDVEKFLSLPYVPPEPDLTSFYERERKLGDKGVMMVGRGDAVGAVAGLFDYQTFALLMVDRPDVIRRLMDVMQERILHLARVLTEGLKETLFRITGPEFVGPTLMAPRYFEEYVLPYDRELISVIREGDNFACIHCHGKLDAILEMIASMEPDALEPLEPPGAGGDVSLAEVKRRIGDRVCLIGNIPQRNLESLSTPEEIDRQVKGAIEAAAEGGGFILAPVDRPIQPLTERAQVNFKQFILSGRKYGDRAYR